MNGHAFQDSQRFVLAMSTKTHILQYTQTRLIYDGTLFIKCEIITDMPICFNTAHTEKRNFGSSRCASRILKISHQQLQEMPQVVAKRKKSIFLDPNRVPVALYIPNLVGYLRFIFLFAFLFYFSKSVSVKLNARRRFVFNTKPFEQEYDLAAYSLLTSLALDFIDGPLARRFDMCSQFGDLRHVVIISAITVVFPRQNSTQLFGRVNMIVNTVHCLAALIYMGKFGHYFKHSKSGRNIVMDVIESNNYWNIASVLWGCNYMAVPLIKLSYASSHGLSPTESTGFVNICDFLGMCVAASHSSCLRRCVFVCVIRRRSSSW